MLRAAAGAFDQPPPGDWEGVLLEHFVHHEIQSYLHYTNTKGSLGYWSTPGGGEVDGVCWRGRTVVSIEVKAAREYRREFRKGIASFTSGVTARTFVVYGGDRVLKDGDTAVRPVEEFVRRLHSGAIIGGGG